MAKNSPFEINREGLTVLRERVFDLHVAAPSGWDAQKVIAAARAVPCGTSNGWTVSDELPKSRVFDDEPDLRLWILDA